MDAVTLEQLQNPQSAYYATVERAAGSSSGNIRLDAVREAAVGVGVRGGIKARTDELVTELEKNGRNLDVVYDFGRFLIQGRVLPPVVVESRDVYTQGSEVVIRTAGRSYKINQQARFVSRAPTWREYLVVKYDVAPPARALLPKTEDETTVWKQAVAEGWKVGVGQADRAFEVNFDRLHRDFFGVVRFHKLAEGNVVTMPIIAQSISPLSGDKTRIAIDESLLRITMLPEFNLEPSTWQALPGRIETDPQPKK